MRWRSQAAKANVGKADRRMGGVLSAGERHSGSLAQHHPFVESHHEPLAGAVLDRHHGRNDGPGAHSEQCGHQADDFISRVYGRQTRLARGEDYGARGVAQQFQVVDG